VILVQRHQIKPLSSMYQELDHLCFLSKNLYNATMFEVRQHYFKTGKFLGYCQVNKRFQETDQPDYRALPAKVSKHTQMLVDRGFKSFFALLKKKQKGKYDQPIQIPHYLPINGRQILEYEKGALSFMKEGYIHLSKTEISIPSAFSKEEVQAKMREVQERVHFDELIVNSYIYEEKAQHYSYQLLKEALEEL